MTDILVQKVMGALRPVDETGEELLRRIPQGETLKVSLTRPRNVGHHRKFFALIDMIAANSTFTNNQVRYLLTCAAGHYEETITKDGEVHRVPKSISFAAMDQTAFDVFFDRCCDYVALHIIPGIRKEDLRREHAEITGSAISEKAA